MTDFLKNKKSIFGFLAILFLLIIGLLIFSFNKKSNINNNSSISQSSFQGVVINDVIKIPTTSQISPNEGEIVLRGEYDIKLRPQSEKDQVYITKAKLTLRGAYDLSSSVAQDWSSDAKLIFIRSNGALGLDGKSSSWQLAYGSVRKEKALEIVIEADKIISQKEIVTQSFGYDLPNNWYDSNEAIASLLNLSQFSFETFSAISFYYSQAADSWAYGLAIGQGEKTTSMWVK